MAGKVHVELIAPDSAELFVNDGSVGRGKWTGDLASGKQKFRAVLSRGVTDCWSTRHDSTVALSGPEVNQIYLDVGACSVVTLVVKDGANAEYTISAANFVFEKTGKYAGSPLRIVLRNGTYQLSLQKERCTHYSDKLIVGRDSVTGADSVTRTVSMLCGELQ